MINEGIIVVQLITVLYLLKTYVDLLHYKFQGLVFEAPTLLGPPTPLPDAPV